MFYTILNYIQTNHSNILPTNVTNVTNVTNINEENKNKEIFKNHENLIWAKNGSTTVYSDIETGLAKYDFFDILMKSL